MFGKSKNEDTGLQSTFRLHAYEMHYTALVLHAIMIMGIHYEAKIPNMFHVEAKKRYRLHIISGEKVCARHLKSELMSRYHARQEGQLRQR